MEIINKKATARKENERATKQAHERAEEHRKAIARGEIKSSDKEFKEIMNKKVNHFLKR